MSSTCSPFCDRTNAVRFDLLDEYSTLVPFGLGSPRPKKVVQYPIETDNAVERGVIVKLCRPFEAVAESCSGERNAVSR
jgi:hypothetical protein